ncbi:hypothetical protein KY285_011082 [Solanum tuberosum]|nr:hypothetical protein KY289_011636 [Solanum tuberosum]KAH0735375.1 hypothetical protein KY285_011082 [Solanum tuberosum]
MHPSWVSTGARKAGLLQSLTHDQELRGVSGPTPQIHLSAGGLIPIDQLKNFIIEAIEDKFESPSKFSPTYAKSYTQRIDNLKMSESYQPPKLQQFDGKENPKQNIVHFIETCNDAGTYGYYLVKEFIRSLNEHAFDWYTDLELNSIYCWEQLEQESLNIFYSKRRVVSMIELIKAHQGEDELVVDFINCCRSFRLNFKGRLSETYSIEMCIQGMNWGVHYILQGLKPNTFEELATRAHDMKLSMTLREDQHFPIYEPHDDEDDTPRAYTLGGTGTRRPFLALSKPLAWLS